MPLKRPSRQNHGIRGVQAVRPAALESSYAPGGSGGPCGCAIGSADGTRPLKARASGANLWVVPPTAPARARDRALLEERARLEVLRRYDVLDTPPEDVFDDLAALAA